MKDTGLPHVPGHCWFVGKVDEYTSAFGIALYKKWRPFSTPVVKETFYPFVYNAIDLTDDIIREYALKALSRYERHKEFDAEEKAARDRYVGSYPPKKLKS